MKKFRIELTKIGSYSTTFDQTDNKGTLEDLQDLLETIPSAGESTDDYILELIDNETDEVIYKV